MMNTLSGQQYRSLPGAVGAVIGSNGDIAEKLPLCLFAARLCSAQSKEINAAIRSTSFSHVLWEMFLRTAEVQP